MVVILQPQTNEFLCSLTVGVSRNACLPVIAKSAISDVGTPTVRVPRRASPPKKCRRGGFAEFRVRRVQVVQVF